MTAPSAGKARSPCGPALARGGAVARALRFLGPPKATVIPPMANRANRIAFAMVEQRPYDPNRWRWARAPIWLRCG